MKRWFKCVRRSVCEFERLDAEAQRSLMWVYGIGGTALLLLLGYLWSLLPGVSSFTQITGQGRAAVVVGVGFNSLLIGALAWFLLLGARIIHTGFTVGLQIVRRLADEESPRPGELVLPRRYVIPPPLADLVRFSLVVLVVFLVCTLGGYFFALFGLAFGGLLTHACANLTAAGITVLCHRTERECECAALTALATAVVGLVLAGLVVCLSDMKEKIVPPEGVNEYESVPLRQKDDVERV